MGRKIYCDGCGATQDDTSEARRSFTRFESHKMETSAVLGTWELCDSCTEKVGRLIARLPDMAVHEMLEKMP